MTYTKELGIVVRNCPVLGQDARKILDLYWSIEGLKTLPRFYPKSLKTNINVYKPLRVLNNFDNVVYEVSDLKENVLLESIITNFVNIYYPNQVLF